MISVPNIMLTDSVQNAIKAINLKIGDVSKIKFTGPLTLAVKHGIGTIKSVWSVLIGGS